MAERPTKLGRELCICNVVRVWSPRRILRNGRSALRRDAMDWRLCYGRGEYPSTMTDGFYRRPNTIKSIVATVAIAALVFVSYTVNENPLTVFECEFTPMPAVPLVSTTAYLFDAIGVKNVTE